jgi:protein-serine/threonine kinase
VKKVSCQKFFAIKVFDKEKIIKKNHQQYVTRELQMFKKIDHPFIIKLHYAFQTEKQLCLVMDLARGGTLMSLLLRRKRLPEELVRIYVAEIILALEALHERDILFRDLKPENVLLDEKGHILICDFGLSIENKTPQACRSFVGSVGYLAPEVLNHSGHNKTLDWYLLGAVIYELITGLPPYFDLNRNAMFKKIREAPLILPNMSTEGKDFVQKLLERDPCNRLGSKFDAQEIKDHPWLKNIDWENVLNRGLRTPVPPKIYYNLKNPAKFNINKYVYEDEHFPDWDFNTNFNAKDEEYA